MSFFIQTISSMFKAFGLLVKGNESARRFIRTSDAHWWLSWLMVVIAAFIYMIYLPSAFLDPLTQASIPEGTAYTTFKSANMLSLILVLLSGYFLVYLFEKPLQYTGDIRQYVILQNWVFLATILFLVPLSTATGSMDEWSPLTSILIFLIMFILFFAYRTIRIILGITGGKTFMLLVILIFLELVMDNYIDRWFGLVVVAEG